MKAFVNETFIREAKRKEIKRIYILRQKYNKFIKE